MVNAASPPLQVKGRGARNRVPFRTDSSTAGGLVFRSPE
jgi:hypothetical protein